MILGHRVAILQNLLFYNKKSHSSKICSFTTKTCFIFNNKSQNFLKSLVLQEKITIFGSKATILTQSFFL